MTTGGRNDAAPSSPSLHRTLARQLRKLGLDVGQAPGGPTWSRLLDVVSASYTDADNDRYTLERSIELSSAEMRALHDVLSVQASQDALTGLPNRSAVLDHLGQELARARRLACDVAVLFIDLDGFKQVNDNLGHDCGDHLLVSAADRIRSAVRTEDTVARLGGDEFVVVCGGIELQERERGPSLAAARVAELLEEPFRIGSQEVYVSASIGISMTEADAEFDVTAQELLRQADQAMYRAKAAGRAGFAIYDARMAAEAARRMALEADLRRAVANDELVLHYQPLMDLASGTVTGFEALVRWQRPGFGLVPPNEFIPVAEDARLIHAIGRWVLGEACRTAVGWPGEHLSVSVNLSARELGHAEIVAHVSAALSESGLPPRRLVVELTESTALSERDDVARSIACLRSLAVRVAIDDFGTGYSSLGRLRSLEAQILKIDRSFVSDLEFGEGAVAIVGAVVAMGRSLGLQVVAEGVETIGQLEALEKVGCEGAQGFHFARPLRHEDVVPFLDSVSTAAGEVRRIRVA